MIYTLSRAIIWFRSATIAFKLPKRPPLLSKFAISQSRVPRSPPAGFAVMLIVI